MELGENTCPQWNFFDHFFIIGFLLYGKGDQFISGRKAEKRQQERHALMESIELKEWWFVPHAQDPQAIHAVLSVSESGHFAAGAKGFKSHGFAENTNTLFAQKGSEHR